ncbi:trypsin-like peptidase domain-containing protein [Svornostia abyssi]|uniref:Trypsin-like peptidase domain-containing protein n=1 Tax=Svornostia abyssi TaxID=2898438 RepID=A0ABY5PDV6_9ACTN|nr:trypsin-like peptidase domain-containing protein [Parviterribacteraceae bacterium J379]
MRELLRSPFVAALLGGLVVAAALIGYDQIRGPETSTVVEQAPLRSGAPASTSAASTAGGQRLGLTPREIYERDAPGVVLIRAQVVQRSQSPFDLFGPEQQDESTGTGFVIDDDGTILTNAHVVEGAVQVSVQFEDDRLVDGRVIGKDLSTDLALVRVDAKEAKLVPLRLGVSKDVKVGDPTVAIGNPFGLERTLTTGVVSALQREIKGLDDFTIENVIQTDAPINPGNSGGPLIDAAGSVIGVNSQIQTGQGGTGSVGIGFAVPIDTAKEVIPQLKAKGRVDRAWIGLTTVTVSPSIAKLGLDAERGALVQTVEPGSPAERAKMRGGDVQAQVGQTPVLLGGDVIVDIAGNKITSTEDVARAVSSRKPGEKVTVTVVRDGSRVPVTVTLSQRPSVVTQG